ncbi:MAG: 30S ribosomal protein S6 [Elusimicrobiota bacterium]
MNYESTFICSPELPAEKIEELIEKTRKTVEGANGQVKLVQQLGKKKLAYPIKKYKEGSYVFMELAGPGEIITSLENFFKVHDSVIRYLTVKVEKKPVVKKAVPENPDAVGAEGEVKADGQQQSTTTGAE